MRWMVLIGAISLTIGTQAKEAQVSAGGARPSAVEPFGVHTLSEWRSTVSRPTWVVFTATWCAVCPAVISDLVKNARQHRAKPSVWVVVIDMAPGEGDAALLGQTHLRQADRILAFDGADPVIRHSVDPAWRGAVPYVAVLGSQGSARFFLGKPPDAVLQN